MIYFQIGVGVMVTVLLTANAAVLIEAVTQPGRFLSSPSRRRAGDIMIYLAASIFIASGISKFLQVPLAVSEMTLLGLTGAKYGFVAALEIVCGLLLLPRLLRSVALLVASAHLGGAICAHVIADQYFACLPTTIILSLTWLGAFLRDPQILWSLADHALVTKAGGIRLTEPAA